VRAAHNKADFLRTSGECGVANTMIDLGEMPRNRESVAEAGTPRPPVPYRPVLGALTILLIALLTGGAHRGPQRPPVVIPGRLSDSTFVDGGRLFVVSVTAPVLGSDVLNRTVSAYTLPGAKLVSRTSVAVAGSVSGVFTVGDTMLVTYQVDSTNGQVTVAVNEGTAKALWRRQVGVIAVSAAAGVALVTVGDDSGGLGDGWWSVVDLKTGVPRWSLRQPPSGSVAEFGYANGFPRYFVTTTRDGHVETRDALTGAVASTGVIPQLGPDGYVSTMVWSSEDLLMVVDGASGVTAYDLPGLTLRWHSDVDLSQSWTQTGCGVVICAFRPQRGMTTIDPATGRELWESDRWSYAEPAGRYLAATALDQSIYQSQLWMLDPLTGQVHGNLGPWQGLAVDGEDALTYAMYEVPGKYTRWYGALDPDRLQVRILGSADRVSGDCHISNGALICRLVDASIAVWPLR